MNTDPIYAFDGPYRFLSNFWNHETRFEGVTYDTAEHAYQAAKTVDREWRERIRKAESPAVAKRLGNKAPLRPHWDKVRIDVMRIILMDKFYDRVLQRRLIETGDRELIEGNHWNDTFWGVCKGEGENNLGKLLMEVREFYRA